MDFGTRSWCESMILVDDKVHIVVTTTIIFRDDEAGKSNPSVVNFSTQLVLYSDSLILLTIFKKPWCEGTVLCWVKRWPSYKPLVKRLRDVSWWLPTLVCQPFLGRPCGHLKPCILPFWLRKCLLLRSSWPWEPWRAATKEFHEIQNIQILKFLLMFKIQLLKISFIWVSDGTS